MLRPRSAIIRGRFPVFLVAVLVSTALAIPEPSAAQIADATIAGTVRDPLGAAVAGAAVTLLDAASARLATTAADERGQFGFTAVGAGRYRVEATADGFGTQTSDAFYAAAGTRVALDVNLFIGLRDDLVVTAGAETLPDSRVGAPVTTFDRGSLDHLPNDDVQEALRLVPGAHVLQTGGRGGATSLFVRGGASTFNKVVVDGIAVNDFGGTFNFADLTSADVEHVEVLRTANSVIHGPDALAAVVSLTTRRGRTQTPELSLALDAGTLGTLRQEVSIGGTRGAFDYFSLFSSLTTDNDLPNNAYERRHYAGRFGWTAGHRTLVSGVVRHTWSEYGSPNAVGFFGAADDQVQTNRLTTVVVSADTAWNARWASTVRAGVFHQDFTLREPAPTGEAFDPFGFGANYLGDTVTIRGANGASVTGRAILDFGGTYPQQFDAVTRRRFLAAQTTVRLSEIVTASTGVRVEHESGFTDSGARSSTDRMNVDGFGEVRLSRGRLQASAGLGAIDHGIFGRAVTPRASVAWYVRPPSGGSFGDSQITFNTGAGIKGPTIFQELSTLHALLVDAGQTPGVGPIGPERSRGFDVGVEQGLWGGRVRARVSYFRTVFSDLVEFVNDTVLPQLGVPDDVAASVPFGAFVNSSSYRARGIETSADAVIGPVSLSAAYTYLDAVVTDSFTGDALAPAVNPAFPDTPIGAFGPLVGARPFRRPAHSGHLMVAWDRQPLAISVLTSFTGRQDDSTFLSDPFFGNSMLLPNADLGPGYRTVDVRAAYRLTPQLRWSVSVENVLDRTYERVPGFPALPRTVRTGIRLDFGGDGTR